MVLAGVIAAILVTIAIGLYVFLSEKPPAATGEIISVWVHPQHTESSGFDANGAPMVKESFDQVMVFTRIRLHNRSKIPLFCESDNGQRHIGRRHPHRLCAHPASMTRYFWLIPIFRCRTIQRCRSMPTIAPGQTIEGTFVSNFRDEQAQWDARTGLNYIVGFQYQPNLVLTPKVAVTEQ